MRYPLSRRQATRVGIAALGVTLALGHAASAGRILVRDGCTLVDAIIAANSDAVTGACDAGAGPDELILGHDVTLVAPFDANDGLPLITTRIQIRARGRTIERASGTAFRILNVGEAGELGLVSVKVEGGLADSPPAIGGGILNRGKLILTDSIVTGNKASTEAPLINEAARGGGIYNSGTTTLIRSVVAGNSARCDEDNTAGGGGIYNVGTLMMIDSTLSQNGVSGPYAVGGGLANRGTADLYSSTLWGNSVYAYDAVYFAGVVARGGGIWNPGGASLLLTNSTLSGNSASAIGNYGIYSYGGGISNGGVAHLFHATLSGNSAVALGDEGESFFSGGGIANSGQAALTRSIVAHGSPNNCSGPILDGGHNFGCAGPEVTAFDATLTDNGGPTRTHQLWPGSNAIDPVAGCGSGVDQRLAGRTDGACDSGSYEEIGCALLELQELIINSDSSYATCATAVLGSGLLVEGPGGALTVRAGGMIAIRNGFTVGREGEVDLGIDPALLP